jgi:hypothetical protein
MKTEEPEYPLEFPAAMLKASDARTIGQFYAAIRKRLGMFAGSFVHDDSRQVSDDRTGYPWSSKESWTGVGTASHRRSR